MMHPSVGSQRYTPEDLLTIPDGHRFDLVDGHLVERNMGAESSWIAQQINHRLCSYVETSQHGLVLGPDCGYQIFSDDPTRVRFPDGAFIRSGRLPNDAPPRGHIRVVPELVLEVVSPNDLAWEVDMKVTEYLQAGVPLVWVFYPDTRTVSVYRANGKAARLGVGETLSGVEVLPGFTCLVADVFPRQPAALG
ncbi:MAG TPA: Uma2 family endonuclease [Candidatus Tectomicrobia bacterium]